jgi:hypothetical protein
MTEPVYSAAEHRRLKERIRTLKGALKMLTQVAESAGCICSVAGDRPGITSHSAVCSELSMVVEQAQAALGGK